MEMWVVLNVIINVQNVSTMHKIVLRVLLILIEFSLTTHVNVILAIMIIKLKSA
jgi:hypothetical protein